MRTIPDSIKTALEQSYGFVLLIKGHAGTGKTTLALELLRNVKNPLYISTRVKVPYLYKQFPWIEESLPKESIVDATTFESIPSLSWTDERTFLESLKLKDLPDFLKILFMKMNVDNPGTVVIDSWDAIAALGETRWGKNEGFLANYILDLVKERNYNLIFILEKVEESYLDYLADGIIHLDKAIYDNDKTLRKLYPLKLRGVPIPQPSYLFTLNHGRFNSFIPTNRSELKPPSHIKIVPDKNARISSGIPDIDSLFNGGYVKGNVILHETQPYLGFANSWILLSVALHFLAKDRGVIGVPPPGRPYVTERQFMRDLVGADKFDQGFRVIVLDEEAPDLPSHVTVIQSTSPLDFFTKIIEVANSLFNNSRKIPYFFVISINYLTFKYDLSEIIRVTPQIVTLLKQSGHIFYLTADSGIRYIETLKNEVDAHFVISQIDGKVVLYGKSPKTSLFAVNFSSPENGFGLSLEPIV